MGIHMDNREFSEIHAWICYGFSDQGLEIIETNQENQQDFLRMLIS